MKIGLAAIGALIGAVCAMSLWLPSLGKAAIDDAYYRYEKCVYTPPIIDCIGPCKFKVPTESDCLEWYCKRRDAIKWRYFFFEALAMQLKNTTRLTRFLRLNA